MVKCEICGKELNSEAGLIQHQNAKHPNAPLQQPPEKELGQAEEEQRAKKAGGIRRNLQSRRKKRRTIVLGIVLGLAVVSGLGAYGLYNSINHPSGPFGVFPLPCAGASSQHVHPYLRIVIDGSDVTVPATIGISGGCDEPLHTHDASGIIHVEAPNTSTQYTLGDFFQIWKATYGTVSINGVDHPLVFNSTDILGFKADATHKVVLLVDGKPSSEYGSLVLNSLAYCSATTTGPPCSPTAVGDPSYGGQQYPFGTGHTIVIEYVTSG